MTDGAAGAAQRRSASCRARRGRAPVRCASPGVGAAARRPSAPRSPACAARRDDQHLVRQMARSVPARRRWRGPIAAPAVVQRPVVVVLQRVVPARISRGGSGSGVRVMGGSASCERPIAPAAGRSRALTGQARRTAQPCVQAVRARGRVEEGVAGGDVVARPASARRPGRRVRQGWSAQVSQGAARARGRSRRCGQRQRAAIGHHQPRPVMHQQRHRRRPGPAAAAAPSG